MVSALSLLTACKDDPDGGSIAVPDKGTYLLLKVNMPSSAATRANPSGGDDGDGREEGKDYENKIDDLTVFFYEEDKDVSDNGLGPDSRGATAVKGFYVPDVELSADDECVLPLGDFEPVPGRHRILVAANMGDLTSLVTLKDVRDYIVAAAWRSEGSGYPQECRGFTMASAYNDDGIVSGGDGTRLNPFRSAVTVERTAARIDFWFTDGNMEGGSTDHLKYDVKEGGETLGTVYLENIVPVNLMQQGTWMFKRATVGTSGDYACFDNIKYCGREMTTPDSRMIPTNYVVEPHTILKTASPSEADLTAWYGNTRAGYIGSAYATAFAEEKSRLANYLPHWFAHTEAGYSYDRCVTLAYTHENTQHVSLYSSNYVTGLLLKATYLPAKVYRDAAAATVDAGYGKGMTFWRYTSTEKEMKERSALYFSSRAAAEGYAAAHVDSPYLITEYPGGVCYYSFWLRHANFESDPHTPLPMEYAIVRNNIYRAGVEFRGPGTVKPELDDPYNIRFRVFVRKWYARIQPEIVM